MTIPTDQAETTASDASDLTADQQIAELLAEELPLGDDAEENPSEDELNESLPQEKAEADDEESEAEENQEEAEEATTWAGALGLDENQIILDESGNFKGVMTKVEGKTQEVDLKELLKGYQIDSYNTLKQEAFTAEKQKFEQHANQQAQVLNQRIQQASGYVSNLEQQLVGEFQGIDWDQLRLADPAEYAARRQDYAVRYNEVQQMAQGIANEHQHLQQEHANQTQQANYTRLQSEAQLALQEKPEWSDPSVRANDMAEMGALIKNYGYTEKEIEGISDHRVIRMIDDLRAYHAIKKEGKPKLTKKVPRYVKPMANRKAGSNTKAKQLDKLYKKAAGSSNKKLKDAAIEQLLMNS